MSKIYDNLAKVPKSALKTIQHGRLKGKYDISPQFRIEAMTKQFGLCGIGWKYEVTNKWLESGLDGQVFAFADVNLYIREEVGGEWSDPIPGNGGNMLQSKEKNGIYHNDEAFKMAITDALSVAMRFIGVAADVYAGKVDDSKYFAQSNIVKTTNAPTQKAAPKKPAKSSKIVKQIADCQTGERFDKIEAYLKESGIYDLYLKEMEDKNAELLQLYGVEDEIKKQITLK